MTPDETTDFLLVTRSIVRNRYPDQVAVFDQVATHLAAADIGTPDTGGRGGEFGFAISGDAIVPSLQFLAAALSVSKAWIDYRTSRAKGAEDKLRRALNRELSKRGWHRSDAEGLVAECIASLKG